MIRRDIAIVGGGAAGFFAAITAAEDRPGGRIVLFEKGPQFLAKVRISGGGRCNVTHACFDSRIFSAAYPRGNRALIAPLQRFQAKDTVEWFEKRGVKLKTENDGRMFPVTDSSETIIQCLVANARRLGVELWTDRAITKLSIDQEGIFHLAPAVGEMITAQKVLLAIGGCRTPALGELAVGLGHSLEPPVPSLFTFHVETDWLRQLAGVSVAQVQVSAGGMRETGPLLVTHWGLSGPAILRLSSFGARHFHACDYNFELEINWLPGLNLEQAMTEAAAAHPKSLIVNSPIRPLPARLWEQLVLATGIIRETRWTQLSRSLRHSLVQRLTRSLFPVRGKSLNKDEFVTCGGVKLNEVNFKTMESRICPGLFFAGEVLDIDGVTGGFNFQGAWTTGWIAGKAMALKTRAGEHIGREKT